MKKEMLINVLQPEECRIAIVEDGVLEELYVERTSHENYTGNIYKGRVVNLEPAIQAAFVDFSVGRNGFLHVSDVEPQYYTHVDEGDARPVPPAAAGGAAAEGWEREAPSPQQQVQSAGRRDRGRERERPRDRDRDRESRRGPAAPAPQQQQPPVAPPPPSSSRMEDSWPVIDRYADPLWDTDDEPRVHPHAGPAPQLPPPDEPAPERPRSPRRRDRGRERPDHMDKRRRPSESRSFGEGLFEDLFGARGQRPAQPEPAWDLPRPAQPEPAPVAPVPPPVTPAPVVPPAPSQGYAPPSAPPSGPAARGRERERERDVPASESRGRQAPRGREEDIESTYLPPNRNQRHRVPVARPEPEAPAPAPYAEPVSWRPIEPPMAPARPPGRDEFEEEREETGFADVGNGPSLGEDTVGAGERSRRRRGRRGRGGRQDDQPTPVTPGPEAEFFAKEDEVVEEPAPAFDEIEEADFPPVPAPPRRGGRDAIRARGGDRPMPPPAAIEPVAPSYEDEIIAPAPRSRPAPARREPIRDRERALPERPVRERPAPPAPREAAFEQAPAAEDPSAPRRRPASRAPEPPAAHPRHRPAGEHFRPGEPNYVPRSLRDAQAPAPPSGPAGWSTPPSAPLPPYAEIDEDELEGDVYEAEDIAVEGEAPAGGEADAGKRKRRRRRRRRGDQPEVEARETPAEGRSRPAPYAPAPALDDERLEEDEFDYHDEPDDEIDAVEEEEARAVSDPDDVIDPELEAEIRREIAEIEELERNMGLRATTEARPRRADAAAGIKARGGIKPPIQEIFRRGDEVLLQVIKESIGTKGPTLSTYISIPGRYLVLMPGLNRVGVSRKIADESQRRKLREIMQELNPPKGLGFIVRTAGMDRSKRELARDLAYLLRLWKTILMRIKRTKGPAPIYQESDLITRTIRDIFSDGIDTIWIDEPAAFERAQEFMRNVMPHFADRVKLYDGKVPLFHKYGLEEEIQKIHRKVVPLAGGGSIVIEQTEALVAIDVNSGNFRVENDAERTAYETNLKAAREIARQLRLRDLGGVIINDFIDMREERHRRGVEKAIRDAVKRDRARTKILRMSQFGIIEMTRQRIRPSLKNSVYEPCPRCQASGLVKTSESMAIDVTRLLMLACHRPEVRRVNITVSPTVALYLNNKKRQEIARLEGDGNVMIYIREDEDAPADHLKIDCYDANNAEVRLFPNASGSSSSRR